MRNGLQSNCSLLVRCATLRCMNLDLKSITQTARVMNRLMRQYLSNTFPITVAMCLHVKNVLNMFCDIQNSGAIT